MGLTGGISRPGVGKYSPFDKPIGELDASDLKVLRTVNEGWYVEYKRECPSSSSLAKAISSFANTHGGWLFLGVAEKAKEDTTAGAFPGIAERERAIVKSGVRKVGHAAALLSSLTSMPSLNPTPSMTFASWRKPRSRRQDCSAPMPIL